MIPVNRNEVFASAIKAHEKAVEASETAALREKTGRGQKLIKQLMRPNAQVRRSLFGSWVEVVDQNEAVYALQGDFPLESTVAAAEHTMEKLLIAGDFIATAPGVETSTESTSRAYDPLSRLEPKIAVITWCFQGIASHVVSTRPIAIFKAEKFGGESTGFYNPNDHPDVAQTFAVDGREYTALVGMLEEALSLRQAEGRVV